MDTYTITIDGGTTNTRCILWNSSRQRIDEQKREVGVRNTAIDGNNSKLKNAVKECLEQLLEDHSLTYDNINHIIASGMITFRCRNCCRSAPHSSCRFRTDSSFYCCNKASRNMSNPNPLYTWNQKLM